MGIKLLNRFFLERCNKRSIYKMHMRQLTNKTIVIDTSIYLYKFAAENAIAENMYLLISIFKKYKIKPIFVFDGKPPDEKKDLLLQRRNDKKEAQQKYIDIKNTLDKEGLDEEKRNALLSNMETLKKQFIRIKECDILKTKKLMDSYGVCYYDAPGEADVLCCQFVKSGIAWACLSDDMDMFVYGCARVLRHLSILNHTVIFYDTSRILNDIKLSEDNLRDILVLSGTDYNSRNETNLIETMKWFNEYKKGANSQTMQFYDWLVKYTKYIKDLNRLLTTRSMFILENNDNLIFKEEEKIFDIDNLKSLLIQDGFIFV